MFGFATGARALVASAVAGVLLAGCSGGSPPEAPAAPPPIVTAPPTVAAPAPVPRPGAVSVAVASADPTKRFVLTAGEPPRCLESRGGAAPDGRAVLGPCGPVEGQAWSFLAVPDGTFRLANRTPGGALCFEGAPRVAPDGAASTPCSGTPGQVWHLDLTSAGFYRLRTDVPGPDGAPRCLGGAPGPATGPGPRALGTAMVLCEPLAVAPGASRSLQDWELLPAPNPPPPPPPRPTPRTTAPRPRPPSTPTDGLLVQVNSERARAGCGPVRRDARLDRAAELHARWMSAGGGMSHTGAGGSSPEQRMAAQGWTGDTGENIAEGQTSTSEVMTDWMNSPEHRANILDCGFTSIGLARAGSAGSPMWVQDFGG